MRITFVGDIMCELSVLKAAKKGKTYDFNWCFDGVRDLLKKSDYRICNLETPMAGEEAGYSKNFICFNAPDTYADAIKNAGFDLVATANNHTFDRGYDGLISTIKFLDEKGIPHTGTFLPGTQREEAYYFTLGDTKVAVIAYTYNTNYGASGGKCLVEGDWAGTVNLLKPQTHGTFIKGGLIHETTKFDKLTKKFLPLHTRNRIKHFFGVPFSSPRPDHNLDKELMAPYVEQFQADIRKAKEKADFVIFYPHIGGQFDPHPGQFTEYVMEKAVEAGVDAIVASHAHVVQNAKMFGTTPCAYSIGNFNMDPTSCLGVLENLPGWGLAWHLDVENGKLKKVSFTILVAEKKGRKLTTRTLTDRYNAASEKKKVIYKRHARLIYSTVTRTALMDNFIQDEYTFWEAPND